MTPHRSILTILAAVAAIAVLPAASATAATRPSVSTEGASNVKDQTATLSGSVNPRGSATTYFFQYGPTLAYGSATAQASAGAGSSAKRFTTPIDSLTPNTRYHYRIVARNAGGTTLGGDRTFTTAKQPLGFTIAASPNPVIFNTATTVSGTLTGTGGGNREIVLQQRAFPYTSPFAQVGNAQVTGADGSFSFPGVLVPQNTQFRVRTDDKGPDVTSPVVTAGAAVKVSTLTSTTRPAKGRSVRFSGHIYPARDGAQIGIQKLNAKNQWVTVAGTITRHSDGATSKSRYAKSVRVTRGGSYRVYALIADGNYVSNVGRTVSIKTR